MSIQYELDKEENVLRVCVSEFVATKDVIEFLKDVLNNNLTAPGQVAIVDVDSIDVLVNSQSDFAEIKNLYSQLFAKGRVYDLFIASDLRSREMIESFLGSFQRGSIEMMTCYTHHHAEEMLKTIKHQQLVASKLA